jgi:toxin FitB
VSAAPRRRASRRAAPAVPAGPIVLDSSCWMEFFADTERAELFAGTIEEVDRLVVPVITVYEVVKKLSREAGDEVAAAALSLMQRGRLVEIDLGLALQAATLGLPLADSLIYATAWWHGAVLWTQDAHFEGLAGVQYFRKP